MTDVALVGATFYGNRGAEAMLSTTIALLRRRRPDLRFNVYSYYPAKDRALVSDDRVRVFSATPAYLVAALLPLALLYALLGIPGIRRFRRLLPQSIQALARSRVLICLAGVSFIDGREKYVPFNIATILPAMLVGVPVVKFAQAVGPFDNRLNRLAARVFLTRCARVFTRGSVTHSHLEKRFSGGFYQRANDIAFMFDPAHVLSPRVAALDAILQRVEA
ncbi:MAG: polysaccharide pyruvyl transferase family protein, partial [Trueperaceae bacterium]